MKLKLRVEIVGPVNAPAQAAKLVWDMAAWSSMIVVAQYDGVDMESYPGKLKEKVLADWGLEKRLQNYPKD